MEYITNILKSLEGKAFDNLKIKQQKAVDGVVTNYTVEYTEDGKQYSALYDAEGKIDGQPVETETVLSITAEVESNDKEDDSDEQNENTQEGKNDSTESEVNDDKEKETTNDDKTVSETFETIIEETPQIIGEEQQENNETEQSERKPEWAILAAEDYGVSVEEIMRDKDFYFTDEYANLDKNY